MIQTLSGANPVADGKQARSFALQMSTDAVLTFINLTAGRTYSVQVEQDATGGHQLNYAGRVRNAPTINVLANGITEMGFICLDDGNLYLSQTGTWL
jgi:hypothetical protein